MRTGKLTIVKHRATIEDVVQASKEVDFGVFSVHGDCMEGLNIMDGGKVLIDFRHYPRPRKKGSGIHDACLCYGLKFYDEEGLYIKEYCGKWGSVHSVGTFHSKDKGLICEAGYFANEILGVVCASWDKNGNLLWEIDTSNYPKELPQAPTITEGNCGAPIFNIRQLQGE